MDSKLLMEKAPMKYSFIKIPKKFYNKARVNVSEKGLTYFVLLLALTKYLIMMYFTTTKNMPF